MAAFYLMCWFVRRCPISSTAWVKDILYIQQPLLPASATSRTHHFLRSQLMIGSGSSFKNHLTEEQFRWIMESTAALFLPKRCLDAFKKKKKKKVLPFSGPSIASLLTFWGSPLGFIYRAYQTVSPRTGKEWALSKGVTPRRRQLYA